MKNELKPRTTESEEGSTKSVLVWPDGDWVFEDQASEDQKNGLDGRDLPEQMDVDSHLSDETITEMAAHKWFDADGLDVPLSGGVVEKTRRKRRSSDWR